MNMLRLFFPCVTQLNISICIFNALVTASLYICNLIDSKIGGVVKGFSMCAIPFSVRWKTVYNCSETLYEVCLWNVRLCLMSISFLYKMWIFTWCLFVSFISDYIYVSFLKLYYNTFLISSREHGEALH